MIPLFHVNFYQAFERKTTHDRWPKKIAQHCALPVAWSVIEISPAQLACITRLQLVNTARLPSDAVSDPLPSSLSSFFLSFFILIPLPSFFTVRFLSIYIYIYTHTLSVKLNRTRNKYAWYELLNPLMLSGFSSQGKIERFGRVSATGFTRRFNRGREGFGRVRKHDN